MLKRYVHEREGACGETFAFVAFGGLGQFYGAETITCESFRESSKSCVRKPLRV